MVNVGKHIEHWMRGAEKSWEDSEILLKGKRYDFGAYAAHLALEKALKGHVTRATGDIPPRTHDLTYLAKLSRLSFSEEQSAFLDYFNTYQLEGRYPEVDTPAPIPVTVMADIGQAKDMFQWLKQQL